MGAEENMNGYLLTVILISLHLGLAIYAKRKKILERYHMDMYGPFVMWKTKKGLKLLERLAKYRGFWIFYGNVSRGIVLVVMTLMMLFLIWSATTVSMIEPEDAPDPVFIVGLPGINPIIPLWYGIIALATAIIIHEGAHGILTLVGNLKIKSLGLLFFVVPVGAFVEPDEEEMKTTNKKRRGRLVAAGPSTNLFFAVACALIFSWGFMGSIEPVHDGLIITGTVDDTPAANASLEEGMLLIGIEKWNGSNLIQSADISTYDDFHDFMEGSRANETIVIIYYYEGEINRTGSIVLADLYNDTEDPDDKGKGYLGVFYFPIGTQELKDTLHHPINSADSGTSLRDNLIIYNVMLPFSGVIPFHEPMTDVYEVTGPLGILPDSVFWVLANIFYWLFWLNLMVGITNALPAIPFDGSYIFKDTLDSILKRLGVKDEKRAKITMRVLIFTSLLVLFFLFWMIIGPHVIAAILG